MSWQLMPLFDVDIAMKKQFWVKKKEKKERSCAKQNFNP